MVTCSSPCIIQLSGQYITVSCEDCKSRESYCSACYSRITNFSSATNQCVSSRKPSAMLQKHQSLAGIRTPCQHQFVTPCPEPGFLVSECLNCGQISSVLLMSPKRSFVAPIPATVARHSNYHKRRLSNVPIPAEITRPKLQQPHSRVCVLKPLPPLIQLSEQSPTIPAKLLEILEEETIITFRAGPKRIHNTRTVIRVRHLVQASCHIDGELGYAKWLDT